ncbi:MAG: DUF1016 domain-containing protein [Kofleriaceae bacterium]
MARTSARQGGRRRKRGDLDLDAGRHAATGLGAVSLAQGGHRGATHRRIAIARQLDKLGGVHGAARIPYLFDFLGTADPRRERAVENSLVAHIERFLLELGAGFAFVGRQVALEVGNSDYRIDLIFYHLKLRSFVVVELRSVPFEPAFVGQLDFYLSVVDDLLKHPSDQPTIGLLLCRSKNELVVEYALRNFTRPVGVAEWETTIVDKLPKDLEGSLPTIEQIEAELAANVTPKRKPRAPNRKRT